MLEKQRSFRSEVALYLKRTIALQASMEPENFVKFKPHTTVQPSEQVCSLVKEAYFCRTDTSGGQHERTAETTASKTASSLPVCECRPGARQSL